MPIPTFETHLPELMAFVERLVEETESGKLSDWPAFAEKVRGFFTPAMMEKVNAVIPGWHEMASYENGATLIHVMSVFTALLQCPEYRRANPEQQMLMKWIVLFHDLAKVIRDGKKDPTHAFRSAAMTGRLLPELEFKLNDEADVQISEWAVRTSSAVTPHPESRENVQDNRRLAEIIAGIERLFGRDTPAALIVKTVLLHMSIDVVSEYPQAAPLTEDEIRQYVAGELLPLLKIMMLVDNDAWAFFDSARRQQHRGETLATFDRVKQMIDSH